MMAGYLPFEDNDTNILYEKITNGDPSYPEHFPKHARDVIQRMLEKEPENRIKITGIKKHAFYTKYQNYDMAGLNVATDTIPILDNIVTDVK